MFQYLVIAYDYTDESAVDRRMAVRPKHFEGVRAMKSTGNFVSGGAILDEGGKMIGSMMVVQFELENGLDKWLEQEPYMLGKVWEKVEVKPFKLAEV